jgi:hypothetical protein
MSVEGNVRCRAGPALKAWPAAALSFIFGCGYFFLRQHFKDGGWGFDPTLVNKSLAVTSLFLLSLSMLLTGLSALSEGNAGLLVRRKYYGLAGFWGGALHAAMSHVVFPAVGVELEKVERFGSLAAASAYAALAIFGIMALFSAPKPKASLGGENWRRLLRYLGYSGLVLAAGHAALLKLPSWLRYLKTFSSVLPSLSLPAVVLALATVLLRLALWASGRLRRRAG